MPAHLFYNHTLPRVMALGQVWDECQSAGESSAVFNFCSYPFLLSVLEKQRLVQRDFRVSRTAQDRQHYVSFLSAAVAGGVVDEGFLSSLLPFGTHPHMEDVTVNVSGSSEASGNASGNSSGVLRMATGVDLSLRIRSRESLLPEVFDFLSATSAATRSSLWLPLRVSFADELAEDLGGVTR